MTTMHLIVVVLAVVVTSCTIRVDGCYCNPVHPQQEFCTADFVIRATVKEKILIYDESDNSTELPVEVKYILNTSKIFKTTTAYEEVNQTSEASTPPRENICGLDLKINGDYLISGRILDGKLMIDFCNWVEEYSQLTQHQKRGIRHVYKHGCRCDVFRCVRNGCNYPQAFGVNVDHHCVWDRGLPGDCYTKVGICKMLDNGKCCWKRTRALRNCTGEKKNINWC